MTIINATEFLRNMAELYEKAGWSPKEVHFSLCDLASNLANEPAYIIKATNVNWIPVEERLPDVDPGTEYLVTTYCTSARGKDPYYDVIVAYYTDNLFELDSFDFPNDSYKRPGWYNCDSEAGFYEIEVIDDLYTKKVTAWMPMPDPYQR